MGYNIGNMFRRIESREFQEAILLTQETALQISAALGYRENR